MFFCLNTVLFILLPDIMSDLHFFFLKLKFELFYWVCPRDQDTRRTRQKEHVTISTVNDTM